MLAFEGKPKFLEKYAVAGFEAVQTLGGIGIMNIELHPRQTTEDPPMRAYASVQETLGEEVICKIDDWRFVGTVAGIQYNSDSSGFWLTLTDPLAKFDGVIGSNVFADQVIEDIVSSVAPSDVYLEYLGGSNSLNVKLAIQYQESALRFVKRLLSEFGSQIWCDGETIYVGMSPTSQSYSFKLGKDITEFMIHTHLGAEQVEVESLPYVKNNPHTSKLELKGGKFGKIQDAAIDLRKKGDNAKKTFHIVHEDTSYDDTTHLANRFLRSQAAGRFVIQGRVMMPIKLGAKVNIQGIGAGSGEETAIVRSVQCIGDYDNWEVIWQFEATNPEAVLSDADQQPGALTASTAVVDDTNDDLNRVRVRFPWDGNQRSTPWLRIAAPSWGKEHMHFLPPRKGDTVLVVWGQNDMDPVVLGCVTAGDKVGQPNATLVLQTVDGQTISIGEDNIKLKNKDVEVRMDRKLVEIDAAGSKIKMDPNDIEFKAKGSITLDASTGIKLKTMKLDVG
ncbi:MAG: hypothetical protein GTO42_08660 [Candidatus Latescibacteria bacterium]|nr:hypothetical protein [Candidatus Latescibacterota bacterium]NIO29031.1 hypothetical protein [Candidatus Latescibacterota bacterium]NIO56656.1 hypothetical protein [Candidatus Latescibacterota bacterium]NIT02239.1 hypothetical protein [Candidatus Latescibacterota bacterium]NIT39124.1 hypothetical protein [Candidatus Latescibacterota bacterium]